MKWFSRRASSSKLRPRLTLEQLEDRLLLAGNLVLTANEPGTNDYYLMEYTPQGSMVNLQSIPQTPGSSQTEYARGLTVDSSGNVDVYNGTATPSLATLSASSNSWSFQTFPGWSTEDNVSSGGVAAYKNFIFASSMATTGTGATGGIVRFDNSGDTPVLFAQGNNFTQVTLGLDGQLYGLESGGIVQVYNPDTLALVRTVTLQGGPDSNINSIAVDGSGNILAATASGYIAEYASNGSYAKVDTLVQSPSTGYSEDLLSIALDTDGSVAVGGQAGDIFLTNESLTSVQTIQTYMSNVFVTFDHYVGTAPQQAAPTFSALAAPTITYGQSSVTLGGQISAGTAYPPGSVNITLNGVTESAAINPTDGDFSASFNTSTLAVSSSPYTITYSYPGQGNYPAISNSSSSLTVTQAVTTLSNLSSPTVVVGTPTETVSGTVGSNSIVPVGQSVSVTVSNAKGTVVASGSGVIGSNGGFEVSLNTAGLAAGSYTIQYSYAGNGSFTASNGSGTLQVEYGIHLFSNPCQPFHAGAALPIRIQVTNASGHNLSSAKLVVTAVSLVGPNGTTYTPKVEGHADPDNEFQHRKWGYVYRLDTAGLPPGTYTLLVRVGNDPVLLALSFEIAPAKEEKHPCR